MGHTDTAGMPAILTIKQVAQSLQINERTIHRLVASRGIPAFKVGGSWRFRGTAIERWIADPSRPAGDQP